MGRRMDRRRYIYIFLCGLNTYTPYAISNAAQTFIKSNVLSEHENPKFELEAYLHLSTYVLYIHAYIRQENEN